MTSDFFHQQVVELFSLHPKFAWRLVKLQSSIQTTEFPSHADAQAWAEELRSIAKDFMLLSDKTELLVHSFFTEA